MSERPCLLFHGFTGGPYEVQPLADHLQSSGFACEVPRLPWHGEERSELGDADWRRWIASAEREAQKMTDAYGSFDLVGFSMGGLLAAYLANHFPVRRLVLLNAAVIYVSPKRYLQVMRDQWVRGREPDYALKLKSTPLRAAWQFTRLVRQLKPELPKVTTPTLIAQGERDHIIHPQSANYIYNKLSGYRELYWFPQSRHLICLSEEAPHLFRHVARFLQAE